MKKWRVGIIGVGGIFNGAHREHYLKDDRLEVVALCDIIEERAVECRDGFFPDAKVYTDFNELLKDETIDSVDICTPNYLHSIIAVAAFKAGKHVFCEKPDAVNVEEVMKMNDAAKAAGKTLMVMRNNRFTDASKLAKKFIDDGKMGEIYCGRCGWQRRRGIPGKGGWFTTKAQSGGGPLIDLGVHMIDLSIWLMGNPKPVAVSGCTYSKFANDDAQSDSEHSKFGDAKEDGTFDVEDLACLQIEFSWASNIEGETRFVELRGTKAGITWCDNGDAKIYSEENGKLVNTVRSGGMGNGHDEALRHFTRIVLDGAAPDYVPEQGLNMIKILEAIYKSAETSRVITRDSLSRTS